MYRYFCFWYRISKFIICLYKRIRISDINPYSKWLNSISNTCILFACSSPKRIGTFKRNYFTDKIFLVRTICSPYKKRSDRDATNALDFGFELWNRKFNIQNVNWKNIYTLFSEVLKSKVIFVDGLPRITGSLDKRRLWHRHAYNIIETHVYEISNLYAEEHDDESLIARFGFDRILSLTPGNDKYSTIEITSVVIIYHAVPWGEGD